MYLNFFERNLFIEQIGRLALLSRSFLYILACADTCAVVGLRQQSLLLILLLFAEFYVLSFGAPDWIGTGARKNQRKGSRPDSYQDRCSAFPLLIISSAKSALDF